MCLISIKDATKWIYNHIHSPLIKFASSLLCFSIRDATNASRKVLKAGWIVELPSSMQVSATFIVVALLRVFTFLSLMVPETWWEKAMHWLIGMLRALGNFSTQKSASLSDFELSPLKTMITPWASFWIAGHILSFLALPALFNVYLKHPRTRFAQVDYRHKFHAPRFSRP